MSALSNPIDAAMLAARLVEAEAKIALLREALFAIRASRVRDRGPVSGPYHNKNCDIADAALKATE